MDCVGLTKAGLRVNIDSLVIAPLFDSSVPAHCSGTCHQVLASSFQCQGDGKQRLVGSREMESDTAHAFSLTLSGMYTGPQV